jgi:hypothetical protein
MENPKRFGVAKCLFLLVLVTSVSGIVSCSKQSKGPRLDTSSEDAFKKSTKAMLKSLSSQPERRLRLQNAFIAMSKRSNEGALNGDLNIKRVYGDFDGMSADELISMVEDWNVDPEDASRFNNAAVQANDRMRDLIRALHEYHSLHGALPARFNQDKNGKHLLSWRVHLLPFLGQQKLYDQFHLNESWDSEHNIKLVERIPKCYSNTLLKLNSGQTVILATAGKDSIWQSPGNDDVPPVGMRLDEIEDGPSFTAAIISVPANQAVIWSQPADFNFDASEFADDLKTRQGLTFAATIAGDVIGVEEKCTEQQWRYFVGTRDGQGARSASDFRKNNMTNSSLSKGDK